MSNSVKVVSKTQMLFENVFHEMSCIFVAMYKRRFFGTEHKLL